MNREEIQHIGTRIYYTGDMANSEDRGTVIKVRPANKWAGISVDIQFDSDGRISRGLSLSAFEPGIGCRFYLLSDWLQERRQKIDAMANELRAKGLY